jgi:ADP-ribose pyrophosphatase YjhB (NUDIX family)
MQNNKTKEFNWLSLATELKAISQAGKAFAKDVYEKQRHEKIEWIAAQILERHTDLDADTIVSMLQKDCGYPTPKSDCRGVIFKDNKILLVKEIEDGGWTLPGGWCDVGSTPAENVIREVWEESGYKVRVLKLLAVWDRNKQGHTPFYPFNIYKFFFHCEIIGGAPASSHETSEIAFFGEDEIPPLSQSRTMPHQIKRFFEHLRNPDLPTDYD